LDLAIQERRTTTATAAVLHFAAFVSIRQHMSAYVSIRQKYVNIRQHTPAYVSNLLLQRRTEPLDFFLEFAEHCHCLYWHISACFTGTKVRFIPGIRGASRPLGLR
jgi:hypothetical protein